MMRIVTVAGDTEVEITGLADAPRWSGGYDQCARTLDFGLLSAAADKNVPEVSCALRQMVRQYFDDSLIFEGYVFDRQSDTGSKIVEVGCFDRGVALKRLEGTYSFAGNTPEEIARRIAADSGIQTGNIAATGVQVSRDFSEVSRYKIIQTAYTLASETTGGQYMVRFRGPLLDVIEKRVSDKTLLLRPGSNLLSATMTESIEELADWADFFGEAARNLSALGADETRRLLESGGLSQKITVSVAGNPELIAGNCVVVEEPVTGLYGLFWIDSDVHAWNKDGTYTAKLTLNFRNMMDRVEAGKLKEA